MDVEPSAPPVVAVVLATQQGEWFEQALEALGAQDYPNQSVLVIDPSPERDSAERVAAVVPDAYLRRVTDRPGYAAVANDVLETVQGSAFLLFCHDDVALAPDAVRLLVEEALRSNAGVVSPKLVQWDDVTRLLDVGLIVDKTGAAEPLADRGELDQEQHDGVRDVFAVTDTCMLIRSDLFLTLGGFDAVMGDHGADVDLCWRAQVAGARVMVVPAARARHLEAGVEQPGADPRALRFDARHRLRALLKNYSLAHQFRVLPQAAMIALIEVVIALARGQWREARDLCSAWWWNVRTVRSGRALRRKVQDSRAVPDSEVRRLQARGSARLTYYLRNRLHAGDRAQALLTAGQDLVGQAGRGPARLAAAALALLVLAILVGSRSLIGGELPAVGQFAPIPGPVTLFADLLGGWRTTGMGSSTPIPPVFGILGLGGILFVGFMDILQKIIVLGTLPVAAVGAWRLGRPFGSLLARMTLVIAYLAIPLPYNALARGRLGGLLAYAAAPWLLARIGRLSRLPPFAPAESYDDAAIPRARRRVDVLMLGIILAPLLAFAPSIGLAVLLTAVGLALGSLLVGESKGTGAALGATIAALAVAAVLLLPWAVDLVLPGGGWATVVGAPRAAGAWGLGDLLRFQVGPLGAPPIGWVFLVAAATPLLLAQGWRLAWAVRLWMVIMVCVGVAWAGGRGWLPLQFQSPDVLLAPAAIAMAAAAALGVVALAVDLPAYRFGWRQAASVVTAVALALGILPVLGAATSGRWGLPSSSVAQSLSWMGQEAQRGAFRVLWLGDPEVLPLDSWPISDGLAFATSRDGPPNATDLWPGPTSSATDQLAQVVKDAQTGDTSRLGRLLAPMAVRYIVMPNQLSAGSSKEPRLPPPASLSATLASQVDLRRLPADASATIYENTSWSPIRAVMPPALADLALPATLGAGADLTGSQPVLPGRGPVRFVGPVPASSRVLVAETPSSRWALSVDGEGLPREEAFGVANTYRGQAAGNGVLRYRTPLFWYAALLAQVVLWVLALRSIRRLRRRRRHLVAMSVEGRAGQADTQMAAT